MYYSLHPPDMANHPRFFPGPQGTGGAIVVPMTDFLLRNPDGHRLTEEAVAAIKVETARTRGRLREHGFAPGNKMASNIVIDPRSNGSHITIVLEEGPTLRDDFSFKFKFPHTPATLAEKPATIEDLLEICADKAMGGNISNSARSLIHIAGAGIGPERHETFTPADRYLNEWLARKMEGDVGKRFTVNTLTGIDPRIGIALPYDLDGKQQQFSFNRPQGSTISPMEQYVRRLACLDHVVVSEGIGSLLATHGVRIAQVFNPTSALHVESALEMHRRKEDESWQDVTIVNDDEMDLWIKHMESKQYDTGVKELPDAKFPMPFRSDEPGKIDKFAVDVLRESHKRFRNLAGVQETAHISLVMGVGCGPKGGQNHFQALGKRYVAAASTLSEDGAKRLLADCGELDASQIDAGIRDVVGAGDAAFTASLMARLYAPLEDIIDRRCPGMSGDRKRIAAMAFTTFLQRVFGELAFHSKVRDLSAVPADAFPRIFDKVLDKAIAASHTLTTIDTVPTSVYQDAEWGLQFMAMELQK